jgi:hypothetical protein
MVSDCSAGKRCRDEFEVVAGSHRLYRLYRIYSDGCENAFFARPIRIEAARLNGRKLLLNLSPLKGQTMPRRKLALTVILIVFGIQGVYVLSQVGYWGIWINNLNHPAGQQVLADLVIALTLVMTWMWRDAKATGRTIWPWLVATLILGSFGPLFYLLTRKPAAKS